MKALRYLPFVAFAATFGFFFLDKSDSARTVLGSGRGLAVVAAIVAGYVVVRLVVTRLSRAAWVAPVAMTVVVLALAGWIVRPYYVDSATNRTLVAGPVAALPPATTALTTAAPTTSSPTSSPTTAAPVITAPPGPREVASGQLRGIDHDASGRVSLIRTAEGRLVVRFSDFDIEGTPDPRVHLIEGDDARKRGGATLGRLKGNKGSVLDFAVPAGTDAGPGWTVLVWCHTFDVPIANATQKAG